MEPDQYYLQDHVVVSIFKQGDTASVSYVFGCIERKYKQLFFNRKVLLKHYLLSNELLVAIADESFSEMQRIFYDHVLVDKFTAAGSGLGSYLYRVFDLQYRNAYRREVIYKNFTLQEAASEGHFVMSKDIPAFNKPDGIYKIIRLAISKLTASCRKLIVLIDLQHANKLEIEEMTKLKNEHSIYQQTFRCREQLKKILLQEFGIKS